MQNSLKTTLREHLIILKLNLKINQNLKQINKFMGFQIIIH